MVNQNARIYVGGYQMSSSTEKLEEIFGKYGQIKGESFFFETVCLLMLENNVITIKHSPNTINIIEHNVSSRLM